MHSPALNNDKDPYEVKCHIRAQCGGGGAKTPVLHILAISQSFQVGLEWYQKQMLNPHNEAPCRKKITSRTTGAKGCKFEQFDLY